MSDESNKVFTEDELAGHDGQDGRRAYVAVEGLVYDVTDSRLWRNGSHVKAHSAGRDLSAEILLAPHSLDRAQRYPVIGRLDRGSLAPEASAPPVLATLVYNLHAHPASVHFPIGLCVAASLFQVLSIVLALPVLEQVAFYNLALGVAMSPVSIVSGIIDWRYRYGAGLTNLFAWKFALSAAFLVLGVTALALSGGPTGSSCLACKIPIVLMAPVAAGLGFLGGRITFPKI